MLVRIFQGLQKWRHNGEPDGREVLSGGVAITARLALDGFGLIGLNRGEARLNARSLRRGCGFAVVDREDIGQHDLAGRTVDVDRKPGERGESLDSFAVLVENLDGFRQRE